MIGPLAPVTLQVKLIDAPWQTVVVSDAGLVIVTEIAAYPADDNNIKRIKRYIFLIPIKLNKKMEAVLEGNSFALQGYG